MKNTDKILEVKNLQVNFLCDEGVVRALNGVNFSLKKGQSIGIVGESGCGKSVTSLSILRLLPTVGKIISGDIYYNYNNERINLAELPSEGTGIRKIRGKEISMIFQEPMTAFSPVHTIGDQICEALLFHENITKKEAREKAVEMLSRVGIANPEERLDEYPFQYSGGMRQRAMIAMGLICNPKLLIADEPTTALDVTIQAQVLRLIKEMQEEFNLSLILITHDLGVVAHMVDYVYVMYLGRVVESGPTEDIFDNPAHPYTRDLLKSIPKATGTREKLASIRGSVPDSYTLPSGCSFHPRCSSIFGSQCSQEIPPLVEITPDHFVSCFLHKEGVRADV